MVWSGQLGVGITLPLGVLMQIHPCSLASLVPGNGIILSTFFIYHSLQRAIISLSNLTEPIALQDTTHFRLIIKTAKSH